MICKPDHILVRFQQVIDITLAIQDLHACSEGHLTPLSNLVLVLFVLTKKKKGLKTYLVHVV